jgi:hypothetical protein
MKLGGRDELFRVRRRSHEEIAINGTRISLRDQAPLYERNLDLSGGYSFADFVASLNSRVFFWPGTASGPNSCGVGHFERYKEERPRILRIASNSLFAANPWVEPLFCRYNSGAPRCSNGKKSPRGPDTFLDIGHFIGTPSQVVEVTFDREVLLPANTEVGALPQGPWAPL